MNRLAFTLLTAALTVAAANAAAADRHLIAQRDAQSGRFHGQPIDSANREVEVFVRFDVPAVAELNADRLATSGQFASADEQKAQAARVSAQQAQMRPALEARGAKILSSHRVGANGVRIMVKASEIEALRATPGVRSVGRVHLTKPDNITSVPWIGAPQVWATSGKGEHVSIGIIDTGIDYTHADFGGSGSPADYAANNRTVVEPGTFPTAKVKGGFDFAGTNYDANSAVPANRIPVPDPDPLDGPGGQHGTHVAGTAAGIGVPGSVGPGVAPGADLYALKVFGDNGGFTDLVSVALEWAMDPNGDGDMSDHLDVVNMSLGSPFGDPDDPSAISASNAAAVGIVVVSSAGNEGATPYVTGSPAVAPAAISVAANTPGGRLYATFKVNTPAPLAGVKTSLEGSGGVTLAQTGPVTGDLVPSAPVDGCTPLTNAAAVAGKIALIKRGTCSFIVKFTNAQAAGAKAAVVYNDGADPTRVAPIVMGLDPTIVIPGVMISSTDGKALAAATGVNVTMSLAPDPTKDDAIADFSSLGPAIGGSKFKPDLAAPGVAIVSAGATTGTGSLTLQGTSMAAPHVAGAAALLLQEHPNLDPSGIKALLQNSTVNSNPSVDTRLTRQGTGAIRVDQAAALTSYATPGGISFGRLNPLVPIVREEAVRLKNLAGRSRIFTGKLVTNRTYPGVSVDCPRVLAVSGKGSAKFDVQMRFDPRAAWKQGVFDDAHVSQTEVDGWCVFSDGKDSLRVGYIAVVDPASSVIALPSHGLSGVDIRNLGPSIGWAEQFTLAKIGSDSDRGSDAQIDAVGFRAGDPALFGGFPVLEFGIALRKPFEHLSTLFFQFDIDVDGDGQPDVVLQGTDLSDFQDVDPGTFITAQFDAVTGAGFLDWAPTTWDFNDRTLILPFTLTDGGGLLPSKFSYTLTIEARDGTQSVQTGKVDLANAVVPDINSFGIEPGDHVDVSTSNAAGRSLWLFQNNPLSLQTGITMTRPTK